MSKRRITARQAERIARLQARRRSRAEQRLAKLSESGALGPEQPGLVVAHFGLSVCVESEAGSRRLCVMRQNLPALVTGDQVVWQESLQDSGGVVTALIPRRSLLYRGTTDKLVAANIDQLLVVIAPKPTPTATTLDRYLAAAAHFNLDAVIILNKSDLLTQPDIVLPDLSIYTQLGYPYIKTHTHDASGVEPLRALLANKTSIFVGQSGVGKSSLVNWFVQEANERTGTLTASERGRHTTTTTRLWHLKTGGDLVDSPGVRQFQLSALADQDLLEAFIEFRPYLGQCKFRNCRHEHEPSCALKEAVARGEIAEQRFIHFKQLRDENNADWR